MRALEGARGQLEGGGRRGSATRTSSTTRLSNVDRLVVLLYERPLRDWYVDDMVGGIGSLGAGRMGEARKKQIVRATIGQAQQRGLVENTGRTRYRLTSAGRTRGGSIRSGGPATAGNTDGNMAHVNRAIAALLKEERALSGELRKLEGSASGRSGIARKTAGRKTTARKTAARKTTARKSTARKTAARKTAARSTRSSSPARRVRRSDAGTQVEQLIGIIGKRPDKEWSIEDMMDALLAGGWETTSRYPEQIVRNNVTHAVNRGLVRRVARGRYRLRSRGSAGSARPAKSAARKTPGRPRKARASATRTRRTTRKSSTSRSQARPRVQKRRPASRSARR